MALHWQHTKGVNGSTPIYTYIEYTSANSESSSYTNNPSIYLSTTNFSSFDDMDDQATWLGYIVTTNATGQVFLKDINISLGKKFYFGPYNANTDKTSYIYAVDATNGARTLNIGAYYLKLFSNIAITLDSDAIITGQTTISDTSASLDSDSASLTIPDGTAYIGKGLKVNEKCEAVYFNATSDRRAKQDILPFNGKALDIINKLQTYTYTYKDSQKQSYGIMAQDMLDVSINGFSFVDNAAAAGHDGDYMSIRESKLVYLLIEGMKEQQKEIEALKAEIAALKQ